MMNLDAVCSYLLTASWVFLDSWILILTLAFAAAFRPES